MTFEDRPNLHNEVRPDVRRPDFLEGMRGLAAWMVVGGHIINTFLPVLAGVAAGASAGSDPQNWFFFSPLSIIFRAHFAVLFFFLHSGLVLSFRFFVGGRRHEDLTSAALRRYFRLAIPVSGSVFLAYFLMKFGWFTNVETSIATQSTWLNSQFNFDPSFFEALKQSFYSNFFATPAATEVSFNSSLWTIQTELVGSFFVFALLGLFGRLKQRWIVYAFWVLLFSNSFIFPFVLGVVLCDAYVQYHDKFLKQGKWTYPLLIAGLYLGAWTPGSENYWFYKWMSVIVDNGFAEQMQTVGAFFVILAALVSGGFSELFAKKYFRFFGHISYSVYLLHLAILCSLGCEVYLVAIKQDLSPSNAIVLASGATIIAVMLLAAVYRKYVDKPSIAFSKWVQKRLFRDESHLVDVKNNSIGNLVSEVST